MQVPSRIRRGLAKLGLAGFEPAGASESAHLRLGRDGERLAERYLRRRGYRIVTRNYACPVGEIDLVALDGRTVVFVEVKTRRDDAVAQPENAVTPLKRRRILAAARFFLRHTQSEDRACRCDIVAITWPPGGDTPSIEHFQEAFVPQSH